jgi:hypothetical protein
MMPFSYFGADVYLFYTDRQVYRALQFPLG